MTPSSHPHPNTTTRIQPVVVRNGPRDCWHPASRKPGQACSCAKLVDVIPGTWFMRIIRPGPIQVERTWRKIDWKYGTTGGYATLIFYYEQSVANNILWKHVCIQAGWRWDTHDVWKEWRDDQWTKCLAKKRKPHKMHCSRCCPTHEVGTQVPQHHD